MDRLKSEQSEVNIDANPPSTVDINQLTCSLKTAVFSKYISDYLIEKIEEMWNLYEKRIDQYLHDKHFDNHCQQRSSSPIIVYLEELIKREQEHIANYRREIEILCSSREQEKYSIEYQSMKASATSGNSIRVPRTPRCIDRYENTIDFLG